MARSCRWCIRRGPRFQSRLGRRPAPPSRNRGRGRPRSCAASRPACRADVAPLARCLERLGADRRDGTTPFPAVTRPLDAAAYERLAPGDRDRIAAAAECAAKGEVHLLGRTFVIDSAAAWHTDPSTGTRWPLAYGPRIDYARYDEPCDVKLPWEASRLQWVIPVGQAYPLDGSARWAGVARSILHSWFTANPYSRGVNWAIAMEVGLRRNRALVAPARLRTGVGRGVLAASAHRDLPARRLRRSQRRTRRRERQPPRRRRRGPDRARHVPRRLSAAQPLGAAGVAAARVRASPSGDCRRRRLRERHGLSPARHRAVRDRRSPASSARPRRAGVVRCPTSRDGRVLRRLLAPRRRDASSGRRHHARGCRSARRR